MRKRKRSGACLRGFSTGALAQLECGSCGGHAFPLSNACQTYYAQPWFGGVTFWTWRADPTCGGASDDGFTPTGKGAAAVAKTFWGARK